MTELVLRIKLSAMAENKPLVHIFSIYMLDEKVATPCKDAITEEIKNAIKCEKEKPKGEKSRPRSKKKGEERQFMIQKANKLPGKPTVYLSVPPEDLLPYWWVCYLGIEGNVSCPKTRSALTFLEVNERWFALVFGHARHWLRRERIVKDFGVRVARNSIDPQKLRTCDISRPGTAFQIKTQAPANSDVNRFGFDYENDLWRALSGLVKKDYAEMFKWLSGNRNSVRCSSPVLAKDMEKLLGILKKCYDREPSEEDFTEPDFQPVKCPKIKRALGSKLERELQEPEPDVLLAVPKIIDEGRYPLACLDDDITLSHSNVTIDLYLEHRSKNGGHFEACGEGGIKKLCLFDKDKPGFKRFWLDECFVFETELQNRKYCLCEGEWYEIDKKLWDKAMDYLKNGPFLKKIVDLPEWGEDDKKKDDKKKYNEEKYNKGVGKQAGYLCLDKKYIGHRLEPCDLFTTTSKSKNDPTPIPTLIHVKKHRSSQEYSHLFNQGFNSAKAILEDDATRNKMNELIESESKEKLEKKEEPESNLKDSKKVSGKKFEGIAPDAKLRVVFAVAIPEKRQKGLKTLPHFSQISLYRNLKSSEKERICVSVQFIDMKEEK